MTELTEKAKELRREYARKWRAANPDKIRDAQRRYWERRAKEAEEIREKAAADPA